MPRADPTQRVARLPARGGWDPTGARAPNAHIAFLTDEHLSDPPKEIPRGPPMKNPSAPRRTISPLPRDALHFHFEALGSVLDASELETQ